MVDVMGVWEAFLMCVGVCGAWLWLFDWHFKARMPHNQQRREEEKSKKKSPVRRQKGIGEGRDIPPPHRSVVALEECGSFFESLFLFGLNFSLDRVSRGFQAVLFGVTSAIL